MSRETKILGAVLICSLALIVGAALLLGKREKNNSGESSRGFNIDYSKGQKIGSGSAKVKLVEFSDFQCPACKAAEPFVKQVIEKNKENLQLIYRHFPLSQHIHAREAANFAEYASAEGKFWLVHDKLFETQQDWSAPKNAIDYFVNLGIQYGLDEAKIREAVEKDQFAAVINEDLAAAQVYKVNATPTFFLNGRKLNLQSFDQLQTLVEQELK